MGLIIMKIISKLLTHLPGAKELMRSCDLSVSMVQYTVPGAQNKHRFKHVFLRKSETKIPYLIINIFLVISQHWCRWLKFCHLTYWGRVTHKWVSKLTIIGSDNGLSPGQHHAIIWTNAGILIIGPLGTNLKEILIEIHTFSFKKIHFKTSSGKWWPFCLCLNMLTFLVKLEYSRRTRWITWMLMQSSEHQQPWRWLCCTNSSLHSMGKNFNNRHISGLRNGRKC